MVNIILKKYWRSLFKSPKENIIYEIIHSKIMRNYTSYYLKPIKLIPKTYHKYLLKLMDSFYLH